MPTVKPSAERMQLLKVGMVVGVVAMGPSTCFYHNLCQAFYTQITTEDYRWRRLRDIAKKQEISQSKFERYMQESKVSLAN